MTKPNKTAKGWEPTTVSFDKPFRVLVKKMAKERGLSVSAFLRTLVLKEKQDPRK
jgi:hypothetical protein